MRFLLANRIISSILCISLLFNTLTPAFAENQNEGPIYFETPYGETIYNRPIPGTDYQILLREHLERLRKPDDRDPEGIQLYENAYDFTLGFIEALRGIFPSLCREGENSKATCMKDYFAELIEAALSTGEIDLIEAQCLTNNLRYLVYKNQKYNIETKPQLNPEQLSPKKLARLQKKNDRRARRVQKMKWPELPILTEYEMKKNFFRLMRERKHSEAIVAAEEVVSDLNTRLANATSESERKSLTLKLKEATADLEYKRRAPIHIDVKTQRLTIGTYLRKVKKIGRVSPIESLLVRFDRIQINKMSGLMKDYISRMTAQSAMIVFMKKDYSQINTKIDRLLQDNIKLLAEKSKIADQKDPRANEIDAAITENLNKVDELEAEKYADQLKKEISDRQELLEKRMREQVDKDLSQAEVKALRSELTQIQGEIELLKKKLKEECIEVPLDHPDIYRAASRLLKLILAEVKMTDSTLSKVTLGDIVAAGYLSGDVDVNLFKAVLSLKELQEPYDNIMKKVGNIILGLAKTVLGSIPITAPFVAVISMVIDSVKQVKEYRNAMANETHVF